MCGIYLAEGPRGKRQLLMCGLIARGRNESQMCGRFEKPRPRGRNGRQMCEALARMALKIAHLTSFFAKCAFRNPRKRTFEVHSCREPPFSAKRRTFDVHSCHARPVSKVHRSTPSANLPVCRPAPSERPRVSTGRPPSREQKGILPFCQHVRMLAIEQIGILLGRPVAQYTCVGAWRNWQTQRT